MRHFLSFVFHSPTETSFESVRQHFFDITKMYRIARGRIEVKSLGRDMDTIERRLQGRDIENWGAKELEREAFTFELDTS